MDIECQFALFVSYELCMKLVCHAQLLLVKFHISVALAYQQTGKERNR